MIITRLYSHSFQAVIEEVKKNGAGVLRETQLNKGGTSVTGDGCHGLNRNMVIKGTENEKDFISCLVDVRGESWPGKDA